MLNKQKGNMYPWVTHTWNPIRGNCPHQCSYCYMKIRGDLGPMRLDGEAIMDDLSRKWKDETGRIRFEKTIFVGSSTDMWADSVAPEDIKSVLATCSRYRSNNYVFQTKNPGAFYLDQDQLPSKYLLGVTLESDINHHVSGAPMPLVRFLDMLTEVDYRADKFVSIEPIMDFDLETFVYMLNLMGPGFVSIGADSQGHKLPEPPPEKVAALIEELKKFTEVKIKKNLKRLLPPPQREP